jgi:hypothetical protein
MQQLVPLNEGKNNPKCSASPPFNSDFFTLTGLVLHLQLERVVKSAWSKYEIAIIRKVLLGWPAQVSLMINSAGYHTEHLL